MLMKTVCIQLFLECEDEYYPFLNKCYQHVQPENDISWNDAKLECNNRGVIFYCWIFSWKDNWKFNIWYFQFTINNLTIQGTTCFNSKCWNKWLHLLSPSTQCPSLYWTQKGSSLRRWRMDLDWWFAIWLCKLGCGRTNWRWILWWHLERLGSQMEWSAMRQ